MRPDGRTTWTRVASVAATGALAVSLALPTASCSTTAQFERRGPLLVQADADSAQKVSAHGRLQLVNGCVLLGNGPVVWYAGTTWDAQHQRVVGEGGHPLQVGTDVEIGGGPRQDLREEPAVRDYLSACHLAPDAEVFFAAPIR